MRPLYLVGIFLVALVFAFAPDGALAGRQKDDPWPELRETLFGDRAILDGAGVIGLEAPYRAYDAAIVPITIVAAIPQTAERFIRTITLIIDENPVPVAAVFHLSPLNGTATISTRVRVNAYTNMRVVAETSDGSLYMASRFVKAAGGCSAPAGKDQELAMARLGRLKLKSFGLAEIGRPTQVQLLISHPNNSGLQFDQISRNYIPAHFVSDIVVRYGGRVVLSVEGAISLSEDPSIHFSLIPDGSELIEVEVRDTQDNVFRQSWPLTPRTDS